MRLIDFIVRAYVDELKLVSCFHFYFETLRMVTKLSSRNKERVARIELFERSEFSSLGFFVSFWAYAKKKNHKKGFPKQS